MLLRILPGDLYARGSEFFMITILKDDSLFANVYTSHDDFLRAFSDLMVKYPLRLWELRRVSGENFDLVVAKKDDGWVVCLDPLMPVSDDDPVLVKCVKKEIKVSS